MGYGLPAAMGAQAAFPDALVVDIDGDGSFLMNIQELATVYCEKLPVKVIVLNNQHLGMVVQWEDRFHAGNRAHTYLGPIDQPEAIGQGEGEVPEFIYPDFVEIARGFGVAARQVREKSEVVDALKEMIAHPGPLRARRPGPLPGARAADDPLGRRPCATSSRAERRRRPVRGRRPAACDRRHTNFGDEPGAPSGSGYNRGRSCPGHGRSDGKRCRDGSEVGPVQGRLGHVGSAEPAGDAVPDGR